MENKQSMVHGNKGVLLGRHFEESSALFGPGFVYLEGTILAIILWSPWLCPLGEYRRVCPLQSMEICMTLPVTASQRCRLRVGLESQDIFCQIQSFLSNSILSKKNEENTEKQFPQQSYLFISLMVRNNSRKHFLGRVQVFFAPLSFSSLPPLLKKGKSQLRSQYLEGC